MRTEAALPKTGNTCEMHMPHIIYQTGPLFSEAELSFHRSLAARLREAGHAVTWPGDMLTEEQINAAGPDAPHLIFNVCREGINHCTVVVAVLDGRQVDDGTAWEIGYAYAKGIPVYGLHTDARQAGETPYNHVNSMIEGGLAGYVRSMEDLVSELGKIDDAPRLRP